MSRSFRLSKKDKNDASLFEIIIIGIGIIAFIWWQATHYEIEKPSKKTKKKHIKTIFELQQMRVEDLAIWSVKKYLKSPASADFYNDGYPKIFYRKDQNTWYVHGNVDSQNSFGAMLRSSYIVQLTPHETCDDWSFFNCWDIQVGMK